VFNDKAREIRTKDLIAAASTVVPLTKTAAEKVKRLRDWSVGRARPASSAEAVSTAAKAPGKRALDLA
jgi:hypothetical protein